MKKVVRILGLCALVVLAVTACKKKDDSTKMGFTATITQPNNDSKTHIGDNNTLFWKAGDAIKVFNAAGNASVFSTNVGEVKKAAFEGSLDLKESLMYEPLIVVGFSLII